MPAGRLSKNRKTRRKSQRGPGGHRTLPNSERQKSMYRGEKRRAAERRLKSGGIKPVSRDASEQSSASSRGPNVVTSEGAPEHMSGSAYWSGQQVPVVEQRPEDKVYVGSTSEHDIYSMGGNKYVAVHRSV